MSRIRIIPDEYKELASALSYHGFDICHPFHTSWYNAHLDRENLSSIRRLPLGKALLVANTRRIWPSFLSWLRSQGTPIPMDPFDKYTSTVVTNLVQQHCRNKDVQIFWDHERRSDLLVSMLRVAAASGLCYVHSFAQLAIHPHFGPWLSLRAVVLYELDDGKDLAWLNPPGSIKNPLTAEQDLQVREAAQRAFAHHSHIFDASLTSHNTTSKDAALSAQPWIDVRRSIPIGREYCFTQDQILYHYTKDRSILEASLESTE